MAAFIPGLGPMELVIILVIILIIFGPKRLPQLGKSLGKTMKAIREGSDGTGEDDDDDDVATEKAAPKAKKSKAEDEKEEETDE